jgi:hypothetical protein
MPTWSAVRQIHTEQYYYFDWGRRYSQVQFLAIHVFYGRKLIGKCYVGRIRTLNAHKEYKTIFFLSSDVLCPDLGLFNHTIFRQIYSGEMVPVSKTDKTRIEGEMAIIQVRG